MALVRNDSGKAIVFAVGGVYYQLPPEEVIEIPDVALRMFTGYGVEDLTEEHLKLFCNRFRHNNPDFGQFSDKEIWDNILSKITVGVEVVKGKKK